MRFAHYTRPIDNGLRHFPAQSFEYIPPFRRRAGRVLAQQRLDAFERVVLDEDIV